jgi:hypothetical protein
MAFIRKIPWANAHIARLALSNGTDFNRKPASEADVIAFKNAYHALDPDFERGDVWSMLTRMLHEQLPHQTNPAMETGRSWLLYGEQLPRCAAFDWEQVFDIPLDRRMRAAFVLWGVLLSNRGQINPSAIGDQLAKDPRASQQVIDDVSTVIEDLTLGADQYRSVYHKGWEPSRAPELTDWIPLDRHPLVRLPSGVIVAPSVPHLMRTAQSESFYYRGIEHWGPTFAQKLGPRVEEVAGIDLDLLADVDLIREISYRHSGGESRTVDWIAVFPECVLLIECKSARLTIGALQSMATEKADLERHIGKAAGQLSRSAQAIADGIPALARVPQGVPVYGLVVTAEHIPLANAGHGRFKFECDIPFEVVPLRELSDFCMADLGNPGQYIHEYFTTRDPNDPQFGRTLPEGTTRAVHARIRSAWDRAMGTIASTSPPQGVPGSRPTSGPSMNEAASTTRRTD